MAPATHTVRIERTIPAPREAVFEWLSTGTNYRASPLIFTAKLVTPGESAPWGLGARRQFLTAIAWFDEEITAYDPPSSFEYRIRRSVPAIDHEHGRLDFRDVAGGTHVLWQSTFGLPVPGAGGPLGAVAARVVSRAFAGLLARAERALA